MINVFQIDIKGGVYVAAVNCLNIIDMTFSWKQRDRLVIIRRQNTGI